MKRIGVLGGMSAQATIDFEPRVYRWAQRLVPQRWNSGLPPMAVWYHQGPPFRVGDDGRPLVPREVDPDVLDAARWLGRVADFLVIPCNTAHLWLSEIQAAASVPVLSMIDVTLHAIAERGWARVGVLGFGGALPLYVEPLRHRGVPCETIDAAMQAPLDAAIIAVMEGRDGGAEAAAARAAVDALARTADAVVLGCTEIPLLLRDAAPDQLINPAELLAEAAVRLAMEAPKPRVPASR